MAEVVELREAVAGLVSDGNSVAVEGFTHLIPTAGAHEIIRQRRRNLTLIRMTPDLIYDQMIGMGCANKLVFSWGAIPASAPSTAFGTPSTMTALHPGATVEEAKEATGWKLMVAEELETTDPPTEKELGILRELKARTDASRKKV